jgi:vitamin B12 transporter
VLRPAVLVLAVATVAAAQTNETTRLEPVLVTGTRIPEELANTPSAVTVVPREQIDTQQQRTVADVLRDVPGLDIVQSGQPGALTSVLMRGANGNQTLVLIDGVRVNNAFNNAFDFSNLPVDNIERIEILRGPQSTLYGSEALGGVINIVTKRCVGQPTGTVTTEGGSDDSLRTRSSFGANFNKLYVAAESSYFTTDNQRENSFDHTWNASGHATYQIFDGLSAGVVATYRQSKNGSPNDVFTDDPNDYLRNENTFVAAHLDDQPAEWWSAKLTLSYSHERNYFSGLEPNPPGFFGDFTELTVSDRYQVDCQHIFTIANRDRLLIGGGYDRSTADDVSTFGTLNRSVDNRAGYAQYEFRLMPRFTLVAGGRVDDYTTFGTHGTYRSGARWTLPVTETILRANVGSGIRAPTARDFFPPFGNPALKPEQSLGWDAGLEQTLAGRKLTLGATYFQNEFDNLIQFANPAPVNTGRAETIGVETFATWVPITNLTFRGAYTWMPRAEDLDTNQRLIRRPKNTGSVAVTYRFATRWTASANAQLVGRREDFNFSTSPATRVTNAGFVKIDVGLQCELNKHFSVFGRVVNLLNDRYNEVYGFPALGTTFWGGGTARF